MSFNKGKIQSGVAAGAAVASFGYIAYKWVKRLISAPKPFTASFACFCGKHTLTASGKPLFCGYCHCDGCRQARLVPVHHGVVFKPDQLSVSDSESLVDYTHGPGRHAFRCETCYMLMYNNNKSGLLGKPWDRRHIVVALWMNMMAPMYVVLCVDSGGCRQFLRQRR